MEQSRRKFRGVIIIRRRHHLRPTMVHRIETVLGVIIIPRRITEIIGAVRGITTTDRHHLHRLRRTTDGNQKGSQPRAYFPFSMRISTSPFK